MSGTNPSKVGLTLPQPMTPTQIRGAVQNWTPHPNATIDEGATYENIEIYRSDAERVRGVLGGTIFELDPKDDPDSPQNQQGGRGGRRRGQGGIR